jgi:hypothetical protein
LLPLSPARAIALIALTFASTACEDLREFKTHGNQVFRGEVVGSDADPSMESFVRKGFASHTLLELTFDPNATDVVGPNDAGDTPRLSAGSVNTYTCPFGANKCAAEERTPGPFVNAPLITIDGLAHDPLSQYTFPGGGRLRNYIFGVRFVSEVNGRTTGRDALVFVSLMESGTVDVRAMAPAVLARDGVEERWPALFGVFSLTRMRL